MKQYIKKPLVCGFFCLLTAAISSATEFKCGIYAIYFTDKPGCAEALKTPQSILSERSLIRREKHGATVSCADVPISPDYINQTENIADNTQIVSTKWLNASTFAIQSEEQFRSICALPFVDSAQLIVRTDAATGGLKSAGISKFDQESAEVNTTAADLPSMEFIGTNYLNSVGYFGDGVLVAVLDGGFYGSDNSPAFEAIFESERIVQSYDFVSADSQVFQSTAHGTAVWGLIAGLGSEMALGAASKASFCLYRTEDVVHESKIEEFNWAAAMERADSAGADVVNSSLGYCEFDDSLTNYTYSNFDGSKSIVSKIAEMAWNRGIFVVNSAGNEGSRHWRYTTFPAEVPEVLTVGGVNGKYMSSYFSSRGYPNSNCIKPEIAGLSEQVVSVKADGSIGVIGNGTSFSAPAVAGGVACLVGAFPDATNDEIKSAIIQSSSSSNAPDLVTGYGIPDFRKAFLILQNKQIGKYEDFLLFPNPARATVSCIYIGTENNTATVELHTLTGELLYNCEITENGILEEIAIPISSSDMSQRVCIVTVHTSSWCKTAPLIIE